jgi:hypothetical protein
MPPKVTFYETAVLQHHRGVPQTPTFDTHPSYLSLRVTRRIEAELRRVANTEGNTVSAVVRRLIASGLAREPRAEDEGTSR